MLAVYLSVLDVLIMFSDQITKIAIKEDYGAIILSRI